MVFQYSVNNRKVRFYNGGDRIQQTLRFSNPDGYDPHVLSFYMLDAPAQGAFEVPEIMHVGLADVPVNFAADISRDFGDRGVILIDASYEPPRQTREIATENGTEYVVDEQSQIDTEADDKIPVAATLEAAKKKGVTMWRAYIETKVRAHMEQCEQIRAAGGVPIAASGQMKRWLKLAGYSDPAEAMLLESKRQTSALEAIQQQGKKDADAKDAEIAELRQMVKRLGEKVEKLTEQKQPEPELAGNRKK